MNKFEIVVAGGGPAGLSAALNAARGGASVLVVERNNEIGSPTRTSGGSFVKELRDLDIPAELFHKVHRCRFVSPNRSAVFNYDDPLFCVMDVRSVYQHLASLAAQAGVTIWLGSKAGRILPPATDGRKVAIESKLEGNVEVCAKVVIDATGYEGHLLKQAGVSPRFQRFGVGVEFDMFAPQCDQDEAVLVVGSTFAPSGYAWAFPWGSNRVRVGVGVIHPDSRENPAEYLNAFVSRAGEIGINLKGAQPIEYHQGLIPSDSHNSFVSDGLIGIGDAVGHASSLVGEGIRWAIKAGRMAGTTAALAVKENDVSKKRLSVFESEWLRRYGRNLRVANAINRKISKWSDAKWDERTDLLSSLSPADFGRALSSDFSLAWALGIALTHPRLAQYGLSKLGKTLVGR